MFAVYKSIIHLRSSFAIVFFFFFSSDQNNICCCIGEGNLQVKLLPLLVLWLVPTHHPSIPFRTLMCHIVTSEFTHPHNLLKWWRRRKEVVVLIIIVIVLISSSWLAFLVEIVIIKVIRVNYR